MVAENRTELMILIATNLLGQNTPAIAVNEAEYGEMWAQDAAAMFGYAATAATATATLLPFEEAPEMTSAGGLLEQAVAVEEATDTAAANQLMNNWAAANQAVTPAARALPLTSLASAAERGPGQMLGGLPVGQMGARASGGLSGVLRVPPRPYVMPYSPAAG